MRCIRVTGGIGKLRIMQFRTVNADQNRMYPHGDDMFYSGPAYRKDAYRLVGKLII